MDLSVYIRFVVALIFVLALIALVTWLIRRLGWGDRLTRQSGRARRLAVIEAIPVDARRRLVLVRRDDREHLLMIGGPNDILLESASAARFAPGETATEAAPR